MEIVEGTDIFARMCKESRWRVSKPGSGAEWESDVRYAEGLPYKTDVSDAR
jgi:hypothetical protein